MSSNSELDVTTFMNLMINLIPFLLSTAVFSKLTILDLYIPKASAAKQQTVQINIEKKKSLDLIVTIEKTRITVFNGNSRVVSVEKQDTGFDFDTISRAIVLLKKDFPDEDKVILLSKPDIAYELLVNVMDVCREKWVGEGSSKYSIDLFPRASLGEA